MPSSSVRRIESSTSLHPKPSKAASAIFFFPARPFFPWTRTFNTLLLQDIHRLRIVYPLMIHAGKYPVEAPRYRVQVLERELALVELAVREYPAHYLLRKPLYPVRRGVGQRLARRLYRVREHHYPGLLCLGLGAGIAEITLRHFFPAFSRSLRLLVKICDEGRAVVLAYYLGDLGAKLVPCGELYPLFHMARQDERAHRRGEPIVPVFAGCILDEVLRHPGLSDVVVIGPHARKERVRVYRFGCGLRERAYHERMMVGARGLNGKLLKKRMLHP